MTFPFCVALLLLWGWIMVQVKSWPAYLYKLRRLQIRK